MFVFDDTKRSGPGWWCNSRAAAARAWSAVKARASEKLGREAEKIE